MTIFHDNNALLQSANQKLDKAEYPRQTYCTHTLAVKFVFAASANTMVFQHAQK